jgi:small-conductance mechanosensitive channel
MPKLLAAVLGLLLSLCAPAAQSQSLALAAKVQPAAATAAPTRPVLSQAEAKQLTDLLNDPQKRASFEATLQTLAKAQDAAAPAPKPAVPLAPDSVGAQLLNEGSSWLTGLSSQMVSFGHVLGNLPAVWSFTERTIRDPALRTRALDAAWRMTLILAVAALAEWGLSLLLRRPIRAIAAAAPAGEERGDHTEAEAVLAPTLPAPTLLAPSPLIQDAVPTPASAVAAEEQVRERRFSRTLRALKRLPFVLLAFVLDLLPLGLFIGIGYAGTILVAIQIQDVLQAAILAYAICRLAVTITRMFVSPEAPRLRLLHVSDQGAAYAVVWVRRIFGVGAFGFAATSIGHIFGLPQQANDAFLKSVFLLVHLFLVIIVLQCRASVARQIRGHGDPSRAGYRVRSRIASIWHFAAIFYIVGLWLVWAAEIRNGYLRVWHIFLVACGILTVARLCGIVVLGALDRVFRVSPALSERYPGLEARANRYYPLLRGTIIVLLFVLTGLALLQAWGINTLAWFGARALGGKLVSAILTILVAAVVAVAAWEAVNTGMDRHLARLTREAQVVKSARLRTLLPILRTVLSFALIAVFALTALSEIGVNIAPLLAGAGILGVAIGFGSQKLVQDFITGIFLLLENAMQVGDWVTVAGLSGSVENLSIRTMRLRAGDGSVHIIPFSSVSTVTNVNRGIGNAAVSVSVPMEEDSDRVCEVLTEIARGMREEPRFAEMMRSDLQLWGVDRVADGTVTIAGQIVCTDSGRWAVQREFNRRMTLQFKACGLRIATPMQTVYNFEANPAPKPLAAPSDGKAPEQLPNQLEESPPPQALGNTS